MGGTSSINAMIFNRGNPLDYDGWAVDGLVEWDYVHCLPYFKRMETFADGPDEWRGGSGPMQVSRSEAKHRLYDALLESGEQSGWGVTSDHNGYRQEGMHIAQASIHRGLRRGAQLQRLHRPNNRRSHRRRRLRPNARSRLSAQPARARDRWRSSRRIRFAESSRR